jgi:hypothetical protein
VMIVAVNDKAFMTGGGGTSPQGPRPFQFTDEINEVGFGALGQVGLEGEDEGENEERA